MVGEPRLQLRRPATEAASLNRTPILVSSRQMILQIRVGRPGIANVNIDGSPDVVWTCRHAPISERFLTVHGTGCFPSRIVPDFSIRVRGLFRLSFMAAQTKVARPPILSV